VVYVLFIFSSSSDAFLFCNFFYFVVCLGLLKAYSRLLNKLKGKKTQRE